MFAAKLFVRSFSQSCKLLTTFPAPENKVISRRATLNLLRKMKNQKNELGDKFKFLSKHKKYPGLPGYEPPAPTPEAKFIPFMLTKENLNPKTIVPGSISDTLNETNSPERTHDDKIPAAVASKNPIDPCINLKLGTPECPSASGPYYSFGLTPSQVKFILQDTPEALKLIREKLALSFDLANGIQDYQGMEPTLDEQVEMIRRIISIENASKSEINRVNKQRLMSVLQRSPVDIGSAEVQVGALSIKIKAMEEHLAQNKKDTSSKQRLIFWISKRHRMLKYLRRKNLPLFVETCKVIGVDPNSIRA